MADAQHAKIVAGVGEQDEQQAKHNNGRQLFLRVRDGQQVRMTNGRPWINWVGNELGCLAGIGEGSHPRNVEQCLLSGTVIDGHEFPYETCVAIESSNSKALAFFY